MELRFYVGPAAWLAIWPMQESVARLALPSESKERWRGPGATGKGIIARFQSGGSSRGLGFDHASRYLAEAVQYRELAVVTSRRLSSYLADVRKRFLWS